MKQSEQKTSFDIIQAAVNSNPTFFDPLIPITMNNESEEMIAILESIIGEREDGIAQKLKRVKTGIEKFQKSFNNYFDAGSNYCKAYHLQDK